MKYHISNLRILLRATDRKTNAIEAVSIVPYQSFSPRDKISVYIS